MNRWCAAGALFGVLASATAANAAANAVGEAAFKANCAVCHQASGAGNPALAPPLLTYPPRYATLAAGREQLLMTLLYGLYGEITVEDKRYNFKMPAFAQLDDETLAQVLNYVVFDLGRAPASTAALTAAEVAAVRAKPGSGAEVRSHRAAVLGALGL